MKSPFFSEILPSLNPKLYGQTPPKVILGYKNASAFSPQRHIVGKINGIALFPAQPKSWLSERNRIFFKISRTLGSLGLPLRQRQTQESNCDSKFYCNTKGLKVTSKT